MHERLKALKRLGSFVATAGFTQVVGLIAIPVIIRGAGAHQWGIQGSIQSAASLFGVLVSFGWGTTGAAEVANMNATVRPQYYLDSLISRVYLFILAFPVMGFVLGLINDHHVALVVVGSAAYLMPFLGANWYFVGEASPRRLFLLDVLPQSVGLAVSVLLMLATGSLVFAVGGQLVCNGVGVSISAAVILRGSTDRVSVDFSARHAFERLRGQRNPVLTAATSALYVSTPLLVLNVVRPGELALYNMGDKLFRFGLTAFTPVLQFVQGWIPEGGKDGRLHRIRQSARLTPVVAIAGCTVIAVLGPWSASFLSGGDLHLPFSLSAPFGLVFAAVTCTQVLGLACLVQLGEVRALARSTLFGASAGVPLMIFGSVSYGAMGVVWALVVSELAVLLYQSRAVSLKLREFNEAWGLE